MSAFVYMNEIEIEISLLTKSGPQITNMIDTQQQYIKLNICSEISIIVVQAVRHSRAGKEIYAHTRTHTYSHIYMRGG